MSTSSSATEDRSTLQEYVAAATGLIGAWAVVAVGVLGLAYSVMGLEGRFGEIFFLIIILLGIAYIAYVTHVRVTTRRTE